MKILVVGATGAMGSLVARELVARGATVRVLVRDELRAAWLPRVVQRSVGDLADATTVTRALDGVQAAFYTSPHEPNEVELAENFVRACEASGTRLVMAGTHLPDPKARALLAGAVPSYHDKLRIGELIAASATEPALFGLTNFFQNDEIYRQDILDGVFPTPLNAQGVNRIDLRDMAEIVGRALLDRSFGRGEHLLMGAEALGGAQCAAIWAAALERPVRYLGDDDAAWPAAVQRRLQGRKREDFLATYQLLAKMAVSTVPAALDDTIRLLGRQPRSYQSYVLHLAAQWRGVARA